MARRTRRDAAQVLPLVALVVLVAAGALVVLLRLGALASERARASTAADAAALAGAAAGREAADAVARANGAVVERFEAAGATVTVAVRRGTMAATATAERYGGRGPGGDPARRTAPAAGACRPLAQGDPIHFGPCPPSPASR